MPVGDRLLGPGPEGIDAVAEALAIGLACAARVVELTGDVREVLERRGMRSSGLAELFAGEDQAGLLAQPVDRLRGGELLAAFHGRLDVGTLRRRLLDPRR